MKYVSCYANFTLFTMDLSLSFIQLTNFAIIASRGYNLRSYDPWIYECNQNENNVEQYHSRNLQFIIMIVDFPASFLKIDQKAKRYEINEAHKSQGPTI